MATYHGSRCRSKSVYWSRGICGKQNKVRMPSAVEDLVRKQQITSQDVPPKKVLPKTYLTTLKDNGDTQPDDEVECFLCGQVYPHEDQFLDHFAANHSVKTITSQDVPPQKVLPKTYLTTLKDNGDTQPDDEVECFLCGQVYPHEDQFLDHFAANHSVKTITSQDVPPQKVLPKTYLTTLKDNGDTQPDDEVECFLCGQVYPHEDQFLDHFAANHSVKTITSQDVPPKKVLPKTYLTTLKDNGDTQPDDEVECFLCGQVYPHEDQFLDHFVANHSVKTDSTIPDDDIGGGRKRQRGQTKVARIARVLAEDMHKYPKENESLDVTVNTVVKLGKAIHSLRTPNCSKIIQIMWRRNRLGLRDKVREMFEKIGNISKGPKMQPTKSRKKSKSAPSVETAVESPTMCSEPPVGSCMSDLMSISNHAPSTQTCPETSNDGNNETKSKDSKDTEIRNDGNPELLFNRSRGDINSPNENSEQLYCICKQPYNSPQSMIACDYCDMWYHYHCIDLKPQNRRKSYMDKVTFKCGLNGCNGGERLFTSNISVDGSFNSNNDDINFPVHQISSKSKVSQWIESSTDFFANHISSSLDGIDSLNNNPDLSPTFNQTQQCPPSISIRSSPNPYSDKSVKTNKEDDCSMQDVSGISNASLRCFSAVSDKHDKDKSSIFSKILNEEVTHTGASEDTHFCGSLDDEIDDIIPEDVMMNMCTENVPNNNEHGPFWTIKLPDMNKCYFHVDRSEWRKLKKHQNKNSFPKSWIHPFIKGLKAIHPYCSFQFRRHYVPFKFGRKKSKDAFHANGYCSFTDCTVKFNLSMKTESDLKVRVLFTGKVKHKTNERRARFVRNTQREHLKNILKYKKTRREHLDNLKSLDDDIFRSGCRDEAPNKGVLHTISSEAKKITESDQNEFQGLINIMNRQSDANKQIPGILRHVGLGVRPTFVMLYSEDSIRVYHNIASRDIIYFDATGSVIRNNSTDSKQYQLYDVVIRHPIKDSPPFVVASLLSMQHNAVVINYFLECFLLDEKSIYGHSGVKPPLLVMIDGSATLLLASLKAFNCETVVEYLNRCYRIVTGSAEDNDLKKTVIHCCASHFMRNAAKICRKYYPDNFRDAMYWMGLLLQSKEMADIDEIVQCLTIVTCSKLSTSLVKTHYEKLSSKIECTEDKMFERDFFEQEDDDDNGHEVDRSASFDTDSESHNLNISQDEYIAKSPGSPFRLHFKRIIDAAIQKVDRYEANISDASKLSKNAYFGREFLNHLITFSLPNIPNWSALLIHDLGRHGTSQAYENYTRMYNAIGKSKFQNITSDNRTQGIIEKSMQEVKRSKLNYNRCRKINDFVLMYERDMLPLQREFCEAFCKSKKRPRGKSAKLVTETWCKRNRTSTPTRKGVYLTPPTNGLHYKDKPKHKRTRKPVINTSDSDGKRYTHVPPPPPETVPKSHTMSRESTKGKVINGNSQSTFIPQRGIVNNSVSCWWIATIQALKPFIAAAKLSVSKYQGSDVFLWRKLIEFFETLSLGTRASIPFRVVQPLIKECATQMNISCNHQQDAAEFYSQLMVPFLGESCLTNEIEISKSVMCLTCEEHNIVENSTSGILPIPLQKQSIDKCLHEFFVDEIVSDLNCDLCGLKQCKKMVVSKIVNCPSLLVVQLLRFRVVGERREKITADVSPSTVIDLSRFCVNHTPALYTLQSVVVHEGGSLESGHYKTFVRNYQDSTITQFNDGNVKQTSDQEFDSRVSNTGYLYFYRKNDSTTTENEIPIGSKCDSKDGAGFDITENEENFVRILWASCNERNLCTVALCDEKTSDYMSFDNLAMIECSPRPPVLKRLKSIFPDYHAGWLSDSVVDFYLSQLCGIANEDSKQLTCGVLMCSQTAKITNRQPTPTTFKSVSKSCCHNGSFCDVMLFPLLENRHFTLYVIDNNKNELTCYDSLSCSKDTRQKMANNGQSFFDFFRTGRINRHWSQVPSVLDGQQGVVVKQASCVQQADSSSCGVFCCLFAEELCLAKKRIKRSDAADKLRMYVTLQMIKRSRIIDPELHRLVLTHLSK